MEMVTPPVDGTSTPKEETLSAAVSIETVKTIGEKCSSEPTIANQAQNAPDGQTSTPAHTSPMGTGVPPVDGISAPEGETVSGTVSIETVKTISEKGTPRLTIVDHERTFLTYQIQLREGGTRVLNEAMLVLDIIDSKTQSLLSYISISLAALVFLITSLPNTPNLRLGAIDPHTFTVGLLILILGLLAASILCLSCLNIVGAHTIKSLAARKKQTPEEYEKLIVRTTKRRRDRYLWAHRISIVTAVLTFLLFAFLLFSPLVIPPSGPSVELIH